MPMVCLSNASLPIAPLAAWLKRRARLKSLPVKASVSPSPSHLVGVTAQKRWIWTPSSPKRCGASTAPNGRARFIWRPSWPDTPKKDCRLSVFTATIFRMPETRISRPTCRKNCCVLPGAAWPLPPCAATHTWPWAASPWVSPVPSSIRASSKNTWACGSKPLICPNLPGVWKKASTTRRNMNAP